MATTVVETAHTQRKTTVPTNTVDLCLIHYMHSIPFVIITASQHVMITNVNVIIVNYETCKQLAEVNSVMVGLDIR